MLTTYGKVNRGDIIDNHVISKVDRWCAEDVEMTRLHTADGGRRTECSNYTVTVQHHADPTLVDVSEEDLEAGATVFAARVRKHPESFRRQADYTMDGLHGIALEQNRRREIAKIQRPRMYV